MGKRHLIEDIQIESKHIKTCSTPHAKGIASSNNNDSTTHLFGWPKSKMLITPNAGEDIEHKELSLIAGGNTEWYSHFERQFGKFLTKPIILLTYDPAVTPLAIYPNK